jgi:hypothetical protein
MKQIFLLIFITLFCSHCTNTNRYEQRTEIQKIIGVKIPEFKVVDSRIIQKNNFDYESKTQCIIEFKKKPEDNLYIILDSICNLTIPSEPNENSSYFYYGLESVNRCWRKNEDEYSYSRNTDFGKKFLHSTDAYFYFTIKRGSKTAEIIYGNY